MTGDDYVNLETVFNDSNRTLKDLASIYDDQVLLMDVIEKVINPSLPDEAVFQKKILLKPNWVRHSKTPQDPVCLRTHDSFIIAALHVILKKKPANVVIGDAPIQGCLWDKLMVAEFAAAIRELSEKYKIPVQVKDFRRVTFNPDENNPEKERRSLEEFLIFDVGKESFLEPITSATKNQFRVTQYNPDRFIISHKPGMHKYCITKELFEADVVISMPKVKTHQKAGITAALKNIVGLNGDKDFLPHHRIGGTGMGGDSYPGKNYLRYWTELCHDAANRRQGTKGYIFFMRLANLLWRLSLPSQVHQTAAAWHGNDTTWRMVMDLNKIAIFGKGDGTLSKEPQRTLYSLSDGIIGGQGDGPLKPDPLSLGVVGFSNHSSWHDLVMATLMGMNKEKIPLLQSAKNFLSDRKVIIKLNSKVVSIEDLEGYAIKAIMPPGWINYDE